MSVKRLLVCIFTVLMCCSVTGCEDTDTSSDLSSISSSVSSEVESEKAETTKPTSETTKPITTTKETTPPTTTTKVTTTKPVQKVEYLSDYAVQYNEQNDVYEVMFALSDSSNNYVDASGTVNIKITDVQDNVVYNEYIKFSKNDFTSWTNSMKDQNTYGCWLEIPRSDVESASSSSGTLSMQIAGDDFAFFGTKLSISDLPQKKASVTLPAVPISITDTSYYNCTSYATVSEISYEAENSFDGKMKLTLKLVISLDKKVGRENVADSVAIGYRLVDSEGFITESGTIYTSALRVGEKTKEDEIIYDLDPSETYTLTLENVT